MNVPKICLSCEYCMIEATNKLFCLKGNAITENKEICPEHKDFR